MSIERNIVFLYPISAKLTELKKIYEEANDHTIYELDSVSEYVQLIGVLEHSVTFSSDLKKTEQYLEEAKQFVRIKESKNYLIQEKNISPLVFSKLQKNGLDEIIKEDVNVKSLSHKVNMFFTPFEQALIKEEENKNKAVLSSMSMSDMVIGGNKNKEKYNSNEKQHIEKMATFEEADTQSKRKKSGLDSDFFLGGAFDSSLSLQKNDSTSLSLNSLFDNIQRKNVKLFNPVTDLPKLKKATFVPIVGELTRNAYNKNNFLEQGLLNKRNTTTFNEVQNEYDQSKKELENFSEEINKKKKSFEEVKNDLERKHLDFNNVLSDFKHKNLTKFQEIDKDKDKKNRFEEIESDFNKRRERLDLLDAEQEKKKKKFEELESAYEKKKNEIDLEQTDLEKKRGMLIDLLELNRKKNKSLEELIELNKKKGKEFSSFDEEEKLKKLIEDIDIDKNKNNKTVELSLDDYEKKKGVKLEEIEIGKKKLSTFEEVDAEKKKHGSFEEVLIKKEKKDANLDFEEGSRKNSDLNLPELQYDKKDGKFDEEKRKKNLAISQEIEKFNKNVDGDYDDSTKKKNVYEENSLDYRELKKIYKKKQNGEEELDSDQKEKIIIDKILKEPEYTFFKNDSFGLEYLIIHSDFLLKKDMISEKLFKFIHFALIKEYKADISFYLYNSRTDLFNRIYCGHIVRENKVLNNDYDSFEVENLDEWREIRLPTWKDETYQVEINHFIYPYFEDGEYLGFCVSHFPKTIENHNDANKVELLCLCLKGSILDEFDKTGAK